MQQWGSAGSSKGKGSTGSSSNGGSTESGGSGGGRCAGSGKGGGRSRVLQVPMTLWSSRGMRSGGGEPSLPLMAMPSGIAGPN